MVPVYLYFPEYTITMYDTKTRELRWNATYFDYAASLPEDDVDYSKCADERTLSRLGWHLPHIEWSPESRIFFLTLHHQVLDFFYRLEVVIALARERGRHIF